MSTRPRKVAATVPVAATAIRYSMVPAPRLSLETVASRSQLHPDLIRRFVALGLVDAERDASGQLVFETSAPATLARIQRLRAGLCLNYPAIGLVLDLLDRINRLEAALRRSGMRSDQPPWT